MPRRSRSARGFSAGWPRRAPSRRGGAELRVVAQTDRREWIALGLGLVCSGPYVINALAHQQSDVVIAALALTGCAGFMRGRKMVGPLLIGLAAAFKGPPLLFAPYFLFRRQWRAAVLMPATALAVNLIPDLIATAPGGGTWLQHWLRHYVLPTQQLNVALGTWATELIYNQSLGGTPQLLAGTGLEWIARDVTVVATTAPVGAVGIKAIAYAAMLVMVVLPMVTALRGEQVATNAARPNDPPKQAALELSVVLILMLLISPMSGKAHFGLSPCRHSCFAGSLSWPNVAHFGR